MKKTLLVSTALLASALAFSGPARADVSVVANIEFIKDIEVIERSYSLYLVGIVSYNVFRGSSAAESISVTNQRNDENVLTWGYFGTGSPRFDPGQRNGGVFVATMLNSVISNVGITQFNQDVGHFTNQANNVSAAINGRAFFAEAVNAVEQQNNDNVSVSDPNNLLPITLPVGPGSFATRRANIENSVNSNRGVTMVNQNAGAMSNQFNGLSLAASLGTGANERNAVALSEADLGQWNIGNRTEESNSIKVNRIIGSVNNNVGITAVNQNSGNFNNQGTVISIAGATSLGRVGGQTSLPSISQ